jgi:catechol 2,3-dioxygenase-like lactoylglutathione lyase family enzyme
MITKIEKVTIYVSSQDDAKRFWTERMGFVVTFEQKMGPAGVWIEVAPKNAATSMVLYSKSLMEKQNPSMVAHPSVIFSAENIEEFYSDLVGKCVSVDPIESMPWGKMFRFRDNDDNQYMVRG